MVSSELVAVWIVFALILVTCGNRIGRESSAHSTCPVDYNATCTCMDSNISGISRCDSSNNYNVYTIHCHDYYTCYLNGDQCCSCLFSPTTDYNSIINYNKTVQCCSCSSNSYTLQVGCNYYSLTTDLLISSKTMILTTATKSNAMFATTPSNTAMMTTTTIPASSSLPTTTTPASSSSILLPVVAGVLLPVCLLCTISVAAATLCIILHYRRHQTPQQSGTTHTTGALQLKDNECYAIPLTTKPPTDHGLQCTENICYATAQPPAADYEEV